jgi:hypothetical protein
MLSTAAAMLVANLALTSPATAHDGQHPAASPAPPTGAAQDGPDMRPEWHEPMSGGYGARAMPAGEPGYDRAAYERAYENARADWLTVCRYDQARNAHRRDGTGGAVVGGLLGGLLGNRIAGRGDRAVGTVIGAVGGAVAGAAIDRAGDRPRRDAAAHDYCEAYLNAYSQPGYGYGQPMMMVPVTMAPMMVQPQQVRQEPCTEEIVTEEWVPEPARPQTIIRRIPPRRVPDKRIRIAPDKRIPA